jgi:flagellar hook-length control protein FliK
VQIFHIALSAHEGTIAASPSNDGSTAHQGAAPTGTLFTARNESSEIASLQPFVLRTHVAGARDKPSTDGAMDYQQCWQPAESERANVVVRDVAQHVIPLWSDDSLRQGQHSTSSGASPVSPFDGLGSVLRATVTTMTQSGSTIARIVLYPESLGTIVVHLQPQATGTSVQIIVSSAETLRAVEQTVEALRRDLAGSGCIADAITVRMRDEKTASHQTVVPIAPLVAAIDDEHAERRRQQRSFHRRQRHSRTHAIFDHFM